MSQIKKHFTSRWEDGYIVEADFSQLEVIALAFLSQDPQLIADIKAGTDMHCMNASFLYSARYEDIKDAYDRGDKDWTYKRKVAKGPGFLIQYGGGAGTMAKNTGLTKKQCQQFIDNYYHRYPMVKAWQDDVMQQVRASRTWDGVSRTKGGLPQGTGEYVSITGRRYSFTEYDNDFRPGEVSFSPTQMKNYPVQGFATGDIVPLVLGELFSVLKNDSVLSDNFLMINTIHDSVLFDVSDIETLNCGVPIIKETMEKAPEYLKQYFDIDFDLELKVDVEVGPNWMEVAEYGR